MNLFHSLSTGLFTMAVVVMLLPAQEESKPRRHALLVGVNEYEHEKLSKLQ